LLRAADGRNGPIADMKAHIDFCRSGPILLQKSGSKGVSAAPWIFEADARPLLSDSPRERLF